MPEKKIKTISLSQFAKSKGIHKTRVAREIKKGNILAEIVTKEIDVYKIPVTELERYHG